MNRVYLLALSIMFAVSANITYCQTATDPNGSAIVQSSGPALVKASQPETTVTIPTETMVTTAKSIPSSFQFLIEHCELKEGKYYLPKTTFLELTEQQQNYLTDHPTLFIIKD
jgi:hypothetical protein